MQPEIKRRFALIEKQRAELRGVLLDLGEQVLNRRPGPRGWTVLQIVQHLVLSDDTLGQARDEVAAIVEPLPFRIIPRSIRRAMVLGALRRDISLPLPSKEVDPVDDVELPRLLTRWDGARERMSLVLDRTGETEERYAHPVLGPLSAIQMLELDHVHVAYHGRQIQALFRQAS